MAFSNRLRLATVLAAACLVATSCDFVLGHDLNQKFCEAHPSDQDCRRVYPDAAPDGPIRCTADPQCSAPLGVCDLAGSMTCVQCTPSEPSACMGATPACIGVTCQKCTAHAQCTTSNVCLSDGTCADPADVAYVDPLGPDDGTCSKLMPCTKVAKALMKARRYVKLHGMIDEAVSINNQNATVLSDPGTKLTSSTPGIVLKIDGTSNVKISDLEITGGLGATGTGISLQAGNIATLELLRAAVTNNTGGGISAAGGAVAVAQTTVAGNTGGGIAAAGGTLSVSQSTVSANAGGGISMSSNGVVSITNNFIYRNGNTVSASAGGLSLKPIGASKVEFNTIVDNLADGNGTSAGGVFCDQTGFVAANNIIFRNGGGTSGTVQSVGNCTYGDSINMAGATPADNSLNFVNPNTQPFDYHLSATSPASVVDAAGACTGVDFDGDTRPIGAACDLGADERRQ